MIHSKKIFICAASLAICLWSMGMDSMAAGTVYCQNENIEMASVSLSDDALMPDSPVSDTLQMGDKTSGVFDNNQAWLEFQSEIDDPGYRNIMGLKFKRGRGYDSKINAFENQQNYALLEKGASFISFNIGLASFKMDDKWIEPLVKINDTYFTKLFAKVSGGYFVSNNMAVALKVSYGFYDNRIKLNSDILQLLINAKTYETLNVGTDVAVMGVIRNYLPLSFAQRFFLVTETALGYKYGESVQRNIYDEGAKISKVQTHSHTATLGISPGITYFMTRGFAFEFMLSPIQIYYQHSTSVNNQVEKGTMNSYGLSFAFTPFNIQLGLTYYFGLDYRKNNEYLSKYYQKERY